MIISERLRLLREQKKLSQGDIEKRTGLLRCYISRIENGHTVPAEKLARALEVPMYRLFYEGNIPPELPKLAKRTAGDNSLWGSAGKDANTLEKFCVLLGRMKDNERQILLHTAKQMKQTNVSRSRRVGPESQR